MGGGKKCFGVHFATLGRSLIVVEACAKYARGGACQGGGETETFAGRGVCSARALEIARALHARMRVCAGDACVRERVGAKIPKPCVSL